MNLSNSHEHIGGRNIYGKYKLIGLFKFKDINKQITIFLFLIFFTILKNGKEIERVGEWTRGDLGQKEE